MFPGDGTNLPLCAVNPRYYLFCGIGPARKAHDGDERTVSKDLILIGKYVENSES
jgi:hypothetical protein